MRGFRNRGDGGVVSQVPVDLPLRTADTTGKSLPNWIPTAETASVLARADRVLVVGCSGGGKTTLSRAIAAELDLEFLSIDRDVRWLPGWKERPKREQRIRLARLVRRDRWVMDGSGASTFDIRLPRADLVLWVRVPRRVALAGLGRRVMRHFGKVRPDMASGCPEPLPDRDFLSYIWHFEKEHAPRFVRSFDAHGPDVPVAVLRTHGEIAKLLRLVRTTAAR